jgi:hypothetical protein
MSDEVMMTAKDWQERMTPEEKATFDHEWDVEFPATLQYHQSCAEEEWTKEKKVWSWIGGKGWQFGFGWYFLNPPQHTCRRIIRLSLPEDGQLRVIEKFVRYHDFWNWRDCEGEKCSCRQEPTVLEHIWRRYQQPYWDTPQSDPKHRDERFHLTIEAALMATAEVDGTLHRYHGTLQDTPASEMSASAVVFNHGTPQAVADRCARILDLTQYEDENFFALLDGADRCAICRKPLRDEVSKLVAVGPDCARMYGIPHTLEAASKRLELRKKLLAP